jgi:probable HAF family extracellular repeat protein
MASSFLHAFQPIAKRIVLAGAASVLLSHTALCQSPFNLTVVPSTPAFAAVSVNNSGQVVTTVIVDPNSGETQTLLWSRTSGAQTITIGDNSSASGINDSGQVVGSTITGSGPYQAFLWQSGIGTQMIDVPGSSGSFASAMNNSGVVIGESYVPPNYQAFIWSASQGAQPLLTQYSNVWAVAINGTSQIVGWYTPVAGGSNFAFLWSQADGLDDLGSLNNQSWAYGINDQGEVVGSTEVPCIADHGFLWTKTSGMKDLSSGCGLSTAWGINHTGWIVGNSGGMAVWSPAGVKTLPKGAAFNRLGLYNGAINDFGVFAVTTSKGLYVLSPKMNATITSTPNPSVLGQPVTFTASVNSLVGPPPDGETVQFMMANKVLGTGTLVSGVAQFTTSALKAGNHTVGASYAGDSNYAPTVLNQAAHVVQVVNH